MDRIKRSVKLLLCNLLLLNVTYFVSIKVKSNNTSLWWHISAHYSSHKEITVLIMWITNLSSYITRLQQESRYLIHLEKNPRLFSETFQTHKYTSWIRLNVFHNKACGTYSKHGGLEGQNSLRTFIQPDECRVPTLYRAFQFST